MMFREMRRQRRNCRAESPKGFCQVDDDDDDDDQDDDQ